MKCIIIIIDNKSQSLGPQQLMKFNQAIMPQNDFQRFQSRAVKNFKRNQTDFIIDQQQSSNNIIKNSNLKQTKQSIQQDPNSIIQGGIMSIFKMKYPQGKLLKRRQKQQIDQRRAKLKSQLQGRQYSQSNLRNDNDNFTPNLAAFVFDDDIQRGRATYNLKRNKIDFMEECRIRFYHDLGPQTRMLNRLSQRDATELREKTNEILNADDPIYKDINLQSYLHATAGQVDIFKLLNPNFENNQSILSEVISHPLQHNQHQNNYNYQHHHHHHHHSPQRSGFSNMSELSPDFNNRNESMMMMFKGDNDSSMDRVMEYRKFNKDLVTSSGKKIAPGEDDNQPQNTYSQDYFVCNQPNPIPQQSQSDILLQSARNQDKQLKKSTAANPGSARKGQKSTLPAKRIKQPIKKGIPTKGNKSPLKSSTAATKKLQNFSSSSSTPHSNPKIVASSSSGVKYKKPSQVRYHNEHEYQLSGSFDGAGGQQEQVRKNIRKTQDEQARIAVQMAKKRKFERENQFYK